ncbi:S-formylglutathione hydrolase [Ensifer sp. LC163]|uniref:S-formylglutathione hydrolase n=1 Tax=Ensifer sp. LC163 TaxID=1120652 RepID=UPI0008131A6F|nr:S-formylglutathione hydrolase [Ensifer sp. LC163]OCP14952.1 S-formylglutathione hydrolase [Ensifer sp. LC163]
MKIVSTARSHGGVQGVYSHASTTCACEMTFAVFVPPQAEHSPRPVLWYLSGLTCTPANVVEKGEYRRLAAKFGLIIVCPDTSPRGEGVPDEPDNWQFGCGAGFYLDATQPPFAKHYRMYSYLTDELPAVVGANFNADMERQGIFGHSMGGHGALVMALRQPDRFRSCSALAPIVRPTEAEWSKPALRKYLGADEATWRGYDAVSLIEDGHRFKELLVDQGKNDPFLTDGLRPWCLEEVCRKANMALTMRHQAGYDHSYYFISTFMEDHLRWHAERLTG